MQKELCSLTRVRFRIVAALLVIVAGRGVCLADSFTWTDTTSGVPGSLYTLNIKALGGGTYSATLTANTVNVASGSWFINWVLLKLDAGTSATILSPVSGPAGTGPWQLANSTSPLNVSFGGSGCQTIPGGGFSGFGTNGVTCGSTTTSAITTGAPLNRSTNLWLFSFSLATAFNPAPSMRVGYYDGLAGNSGNVRFTQMSQAVPEPGALALMGAGLLLLAGLVQNKFANVGG